METYGVFVLLEINHASKNRDGCMEGRVHERN